MLDTTSNNVNFGQGPVLVAMSGGIDSALSASMLKQQGYEVKGCILKMHEYNESSIESAKIVCQNIDIPLIIKDVTAEFKNIVQDDFYGEYIAGRTPNPCVLCNKMIKFKEIATVADDNSIFNIATGHYAQKIYDSQTGRYTFSKAKALYKDQTYVLWDLPQDIIKRVIFPLSNLQTKAKTIEYPALDDVLMPKKTYKNTIHAPESQDICFIPSGDYHSFITDFCKSKHEEYKITPGDIVIDGKVVGKHKGCAFYTIGQRRGLGVAYKVPVYVKNIDVLHNVIELATIDNTYSAGLIATAVNIIKYDNCLPEKEYTVKIRYKDAGRKAFCKLVDGNLIVHFNEKCSSIAPGQSVVLYEDDVLVGGGKILKSQSHLQ